MVIKAIRKTDLSSIRDKVVAEIAAIEPDDDHEEIHDYLILLNTIEDWPFVVALIHFEEYDIRVTIQEWEKSYESKQWRQKHWYALEDKSIKPLTRADKALCNFFDQRAYLFEQKKDRETKGKTMEWIIFDHEGMRDWFSTYTDAVVFKDKFCGPDAEVFPLRHSFP